MGLLLWPRVIKSKYVFYLTVSIIVRTCIKMLVDGAFKLSFLPEGWASVFSGVDRETFLFLGGGGGCWP